MYYADYYCQRLALLHSRSSVHCVQLLSLPISFRQRLLSWLAFRLVEAPIYLQDVMATALDLAGVKKPEHVEFQSLLPLIRGESTRATAETVYGAYLQLQRAVIADGMKLPMIVLTEICASGAGFDAVYRVGV
jgi:hypothetical protein